MRSSSSLQSSSGRSTPSTRSSLTDLKRPGSSRGFRLQLPKYVRSRPGSSLGSRPSTPSTPTFRAEPYSGTISVSIRPNPLLEGSLNWLIDESSNLITNVADNSTYSFDNVFAAARGVTNAHVYEKACAHLVKNFLNEAYNCTLFAYGMTGSGKTYSMRGEDLDPGFVRLAIDDIYRKIDTSAGSKSYLLNVSYLEIYNEKILDLLSNGAHPELKIRDDVEYGTKIVGITSANVQSKDHLLQLIKAGDLKRKTSATDFNSRSSRSHAIMQIRLHTVDRANSAESHCTLSLCDLAGSERATSSVERRKEGAFINKSLLALSTVINKLSLLSTSNAGSTDHIPYRDLKLTRLLQPALSGSLLILILCTVHLGAKLAALDLQVVTETANTLRFAARAKDIVISVKANQRIVGDDSQKLVSELRQTIENQQRELAVLKGSRLPALPSGLRDDKLVSELKAEVQVQKEKIAHLSRLNDLQRTETVLLRNDALNDILGLDMDGLPKRMMANLEEFYSRVNYEMQEYRAYIASLEKQLKAAHQAAVPVQRPVGRVEELLKDQEEEINQLKETIKDKDHVIHSLTKTSKLRRMVDATSAFKHDRDDGYLISAKSSPTKATQV